MAAPTDHDDRLPPGPAAPPRPSSTSDGPTRPVRVLVVDDHDLMRSGTVMLLGEFDEVVVVGEARDGHEAVARTTALAPDVVLMDVRMPGMDGIEATRRITAASVASRVLVLTTFDLDAYAFGALAAGASGFLVKECEVADLVQGILAVARGDAMVAPRATMRLIDVAKDVLPRAATPSDAGWAELTPREKDVVLAVARGLSNADVAAQLFISEATVKSHVASVLRKLGLRDRVHVVIWAFRNKLAGL